ncbi:MAG: aldose 1-epimerase, partial [Planctomycetota bacterium]
IGLHGRRRDLDRLGSLKITEYPYSMREPASQTGDTLPTNQSQESGTDLMNKAIGLAIYCLAVFVASNHVGAGEIRKEKHAESGWSVYTLQQENTVVKVLPNAGFNAFSFQVEGREFFHQADRLTNVAGVRCGNPILYPTPNRVRGGQFSFQGKNYRLKPSGKGNHIHGLVNRLPWRVVSTTSDDQSATISAMVEFKPGTDRFRLFPFPHKFQVSISVESGRVRWTYLVDNSNGDSDVPFGVGFHPYWKYQDDRKATRLRIPASHLMESTKMLPTGNLLKLDNHRLDARQGVSLAGFVADDVFFGMRPEAPATIESTRSKVRVRLQASKEFTHIVAWTPDRPFFSVENQTCSTDAHNLAASGKNDVAHLQICPAGKTMTGFVEYVVEPVE